jgi:small subunit ribosomal protein S6
LKKYETIVILDERLVENQGKDFAEQFTQLIKENGGNHLETIQMGKKQFSYPIKKRKTGLYWDFIYELSPDKATVINEKYHLADKVLRIRTYLC